MRSTLASMAVFLVVSATLLAQPNGSINGTVLDTSAAVIPNAKISLVSTGSGQTWNAVSSEQGYFV
ncbi:MAG: carboxypeptidase-like regulatory domain-containing protein, partial [Acidobacteria bacterium]|nr:carboxypeptidase-like regulatory domain-containing protein [Acidobacteriota bacterium]